MRLGVDPLGNSHDVIHIDTEVAHCALELEAVEGGRHTEKMFARFGPFPDDLPDYAAQ